MSKDYYKAQLAQIKPELTIYAPTIKVFANGNGTDTKHMDLNKESAEVLISWLNKKFIKKQRKNFYINIGTGMSKGMFNILPLDKEDRRISYWFNIETKRDLMRMPTLEFNRACENMLTHS